MEDAEHKGLCDTELTTKTQTRKEKTATVEKFHDTVDELDASMENLAMEVAKLQVSHQVEVHEGPRFVVRQSRDTDWETAFSGVPGLVVVRVLLCISTILESSAVLDDFSVAFMNTPLHDTEFIKPPIEAESDSRHVWKIAEGAQ